MIAAVVGFVDCINRADVGDGLVRTWRIAPDAPETRVRAGTPNSL
jgi:hypothetical protein